MAIGRDRSQTVLMTGMNLEQANAARDAEAMARLCVSQSQLYVLTAEGKVNAYKLHLVIDSVRPDTNHPGIPLFSFLLTAREGRV